MWSGTLTETIPYSCPGCEKEFVSKSSRSRHCIVVHKAISAGRAGLLDIPSEQASEVESKVRAQRHRPRQRPPDPSSDGPAAAPTPSTSDSRSSPSSPGLSSQPRWLESAKCRRRIQRWVWTQLHPRPIRKSFRTTTESSATLRRIDVGVERGLQGDRRWW